MFEMPQVHTATIAEAGRGDRRSALVRLPLFIVTAFGVATAPAWSFLPGIIAVFALVFAISAARRANPGLALGLFMALPYFMGWEIGPIIHRYVAAFGSALVFNAAATTGFGMAAMGSVAYLFQINYRRLTGIAFAGLLVLLLPPSFLHSADRFERMQNPVIEHAM